MNGDRKLPNEIVWEGTHLSETALTAIADGQASIVDGPALEHAESCDSCAGRLGRLALLSSAIGEALAMAPPVRATSRPHVAVARPWLAVALGLSVALLAALPLLRELSSFASYIAVFATRGVPVLARGGLALATSDAVSRALPTATLAASALLVLMGFIVARSSPRRASVSSSQGSMS